MNYINISNNKYKLKFLEKFNLKILRGNTLLGAKVAPRLIARAHSVSVLTPPLPRSSLCLVHQIDLKAEYGANSRTAGSSRLPRMDPAMMKAIFERVQRMSAWVNMRGPSEYFGPIRLPQPSAGRTTAEILSKRVTTNLAYVLCRVVHTRVVCCTSSVTAVVACQHPALVLASLLFLRTRWPAGCCCCCVASSSFAIAAAPV